MSGFGTFVVGGLSFLAGLETAEIVIGYSLSDKLKDLFEFVKSKITGAKAGVEKLAKKL